MKLLRIVFAVLWILDTTLTSFFVSILGPEVEANPVMYSVLVNYGIPAFIVLKTLVLFAWFLFPENIKWIRVVSVALTAIMVYIIGVSLHLLWTLAFTPQVLM